MNCVILEVLELKAVCVKTVKTMKGCESQKKVGAMEANDASYIK